MWGESRRKGKLLLRAAGFRAYIYFGGPLLDSMEYTCECVPLAASSLRYSQATVWKTRKCV